MSLLHDLCRTARDENRSVLLEPEGLDLLASVGLDVPRRINLALGQRPTPEQLRSLPGERIVLKVESPQILHKSDLGGVRLLPKTVEDIVPVMQELEGRLAHMDLRGFGLHECVPFRGEFGAELLVGIRRTPEFGNVVVLGPGGIHSEALAHMMRGQVPAVFHPASTPAAGPLELLDANPFTRFLTRPQRGQAPLVDPELLSRTLAAFLQLARDLDDSSIRDLEVNPFVLSGNRLIALDALATLDWNPRPTPALPRPIARIRNLLLPDSVAVIGVSQTMNPGRIMVENLKKLGFPAERITILKAGETELSGCRCVPGLAALEQPVDLLVCSISADQVPALVEEAATTGKARSLVLIPGGMEEKAGGAPALQSMHAALAASRATPGGGPVLNGANCVGFRSLPGRVDTLFIPDHKLPAPILPGAPIALISQSGAFLVSALDRLGSLSPRYALSIGNQTDLSAADYLEYFAEDTELELVAVYMEGFKPGDGSRFVEWTRRITDSGRRVLLYVAGRTSAGAQASASHTASVAGDHLVIQNLARQAGALVCDSLDEFGELLKLCTQLVGRRPGQGRVGAISNAGFECVAIADNLGGLELASFTPRTESRLQTFLEKARVERIVDLHNPLDLTPMANDAVFGDVVGSLADAEEVDALVVGCVPMTPALHSLAAGAGHAEDLTAPDAVAAGIARVFHGSSKPMVVAVDGGENYHPLRRHLDQLGVPVVVTVEKATRLLALWYGKP